MRLLIELVGMQGHVFHLVGNEFKVLARDMKFIGGAIFLPFSLGRIILHFLSWLLSSASLVQSFVIPLSESTLSLTNITLNGTLTTVVNLTSANNQNCLPGQDGEILEVTETALPSSISSAIATDLFNVQSVRDSLLSDVITLAVGEMCMLALIAFYLGVIALIRHFRGEPLVTGRFYSISSIAEAIRLLLRQFVAAMRHLMTMIKAALVLVIDLGVIPLIGGWWLDVCTLKMFGNSMSQRVEFFSASPLASSLVHWVVGFVYLLQLGIFFSLLRGVLSNGLLDLLRDPDDPPNFKPFHQLVDGPIQKYVRRVLSVLAGLRILIMMLAFLPVKIATRVSPSTFPLDFSVSDPFTEFPINMLLLQMLIPFARKCFKMHHTLESLLRFWLIGVGSALGLMDLLLLKPEDAYVDMGNVDQGIQDRGHAQIGVHERALALGDTTRPDHVVSNAAAAEELDSAELERRVFGPRIRLLLLLAWITLLVSNTALIILPVSLGLALFNALPYLPITHGIKCNDIYAFVIGSYALWTALAGARYCVNQIRTRRTKVLLGKTWKWCIIILKSAPLLSVWIFVIPVLIGLLLKFLVILPAVPVDEMKARSSSSGSTF